MDDIKSIIAKNISALRIDAGMTQLDLAEKLNYSDKAVSKWERAESVPDVSVLKKIADLFNVPLDYLVRTEHEIQEIETDVKIENHQRKYNYGFITGMCILLVWLIATLVFIILDISTSAVYAHWLSFTYAVPVTMIVWLVLNSVWFNRRTNFLIISFLMWTLLASLYVTFLLFGLNFWLIFVLGIPGQTIILLWSKLKFKKKLKRKNKNIKG